MDTPFKSYQHVKSSIPSKSPKEARKILRQQIHDRKMKLPQAKLYMRKIFERVPCCFFHDLLVQPGDADPKYYHIFIGANNRYAFAYPVNNKTAATAIKTLNKFIEDNKKLGKSVIKLTSDGECAFKSDKFVNACRENKIMLKIIPDGAHSTLGIVDRFIRTLRDMNQPLNKAQDQQYDDEFLEFSPEKMKTFIDIYNNAYHNSIKCSPAEMYNDESLEKEYIAKCIKKRAIQDTIKDFNLPEGIYVRYRMNKNDLNGHKRRSKLSREKYIINKRIGSRYLLQSADGKIISKSRFELVKAEDDEPIGLTFQQNDKVNPESVYTGILYY